MMVGAVERGRYLVPCVEHLLEFCDEVVLGLDGGRDVWPGAVPSRVVMLSAPDGFGFYAHEGQARQRLLDFTLTREVTHVLSIDADEFVTDGTLLRQNLEANPTAVAWSLCMQEIWKASPDVLYVRQDGGWVEHDVPILYRPAGLPGTLRMPDRALASGRTPDALRRATSRAHTCTGILHLGWTNESERAARYQRYVDHDGGRFHAGSHLGSIMWPDVRVTLTVRSWPDGLLPYRDAILSHASVNTDVAP